MTLPTWKTLVKKLEVKLNIPDKFVVNDEDKDRLGEVVDKLNVFWVDQKETELGHAALEAFLKRTAILICFEELCTTLFNLKAEDVKKFRDISDTILGAEFFKEYIKKVITEKARKSLVLCGKKSKKVTVVAFEMEKPIKHIAKHLSTNFVCVLWLKPSVLKSACGIEENQIEVQPIVNWITDESKETNSILAKIGYHIIKKSDPNVFLENLPPKPSVLTNLLYGRLIKMFNKRLEAITQISNMSPLSPPKKGMKGAAGMGPVNQEDDIKFILYCNYKLDELVSKKSHRPVSKISKKSNAKKGQANNPGAQTTVAASSKMKLPSVSKQKVDGSKQKKTGSDKNSTGKKDGRNKTPTTSLRLEEGKEDKEEAIVTTLLQDFMNQRNEIEKDGKLNTDGAVKDVEKWTEDKIKTMLERI